MTNPKNRLLRPLSYVVAALSILILTGQAAAAAQTSSQGGGNGLRVSPVRKDLTVSPGQSQNVTVTVTNVTSGSENLQVVVNDFTASKDETGQPALLLNPGDYNTNHSLKKFVTVPGPFTLKAGESKDVQVTVSIPKGIPGGGYYGAVRFVPATSSSGKSVTLSGSVGSLILVKVPGNITEKVSIASFGAAKKNGSISKFFFNHSSLTAIVRFNNTGDVQEEPFGKVVLKNSSGKVLEADEINNTDPRGNVLPSSIRKFVVPLNKVGSFGKFTIEGNFGYGSSGQLVSAKTTFYVIPLAVVIIVGVILLLILFAIFGLPRIVRSYNQRVVRRASRR